MASENKDVTYTLKVNVDPAAIANAQKVADAVKGATPGRGRTPISFEDGPPIFGSAGPSIHDKFRGTATADQRITLSEVAPSSLGVNQAGGGWHRPPSSGPPVIGFFSTRGDEAAKRASVDRAAAEERAEAIAKRGMETAKKRLELEERSREVTARRVEGIKQLAEGFESGTKSLVAFGLMTEETERKLTRLGLAGFGAISAIRSASSILKGVAGLSGMGLGEGALGPTFSSKIFAHGLWQGGASATAATAGATAPLALAAVAGISAIAGAHALGGFASGIGRWATGGSFADKPGSWGDQVGTFTATNFTNARAIGAGSAMSERMAGRLLSNPFLTGVEGSANDSIRDIRRGQPTQDSTSGELSQRLSQLRGDQATSQRDRTQKYAARKTWQENPQDNEAQRAELLNKLTEENYRRETRFTSLRFESEMRGENDPAHGHIVRRARENAMVEVNKLMPRRDVANPYSEQSEAADEKVNLERNRAILQVLTQQLDVKKRILDVTKATADREMDAAHRGVAEVEDAEVRLGLMSRGKQNSLNRLKQKALSGGKITAAQYGRIEGFLSPDEKDKINTNVRGRVKNSGVISGIRADQIRRGQGADAVGRQAGDQAADIENQEGNFNFVDEIVPFMPGFGPGFKIPREQKGMRGLRKDIKEGAEKTEDIDRAVQSLVKSLKDFVTALGKEGVLEKDKGNAALQGRASRNAAFSGSERAIS